MQHKSILRRFTYLLTIHISALVLLTLFRLLFYASVRTQMTAEVSGNLHYVLTAFVRGLWFDNVVACYVMAVPLLFVSVVSVGGLWKSWMYRAVNVWFGVMYVPVFMASAGNIPYFAYFGKLLNASIWNWADQGTTTLGMIFGEKAYYLYIASFFVATAAFTGLLILIRKKVLSYDSQDGRVTRSWQNVIFSSIISVVMLGACFFGIRGRVGYNPIKISAAYFCSDTVMNNLGVNPTFALLRSTLDDMRPENKRLHLMDDAAAIKLVQQMYGRNGLSGISPVARKVVARTAPTRQNVVIVLMESMSAKLMSRFGNDKNLTPYLDSLYNTSLSFANCYSAGSHTNHGIFATICSFPALMFRNEMKNSDVGKYSGLPVTLKENGYTNLFFMTHESQYDNMNAFLRTNGFDEIYSQEDYPKDKIVNHFGVADDYLFEYALPVLRCHAQQGTPFFATLLTISNHPPYVIPEKYQDKSLTPEEQIVRYSDDCIRHFMEAAEREEWAENTIFVFLGDHGKLMGKTDCELPESFNHIPLIFHSRSLQPQERLQFAGQVDIAPTLLALLGISYTQNNLGLDLLNDTPRPMAFYTADKTIAARDANHLYVYNSEQKKEYCYCIKGTKNVECNFSSEFERLKNYVFPLLQTTEYMLQNKMTTNKPQSK